LTREPEPIVGKNGYKMNKIYLNFEITVTYHKMLHLMADVKKPLETLHIDIDGRSQLFVETHRCRRMKDNGYLVR